MVKVKICGITNLQDALASVEAGCDALGFVFYKKSPRYIDSEEAREIIQALPKEIVKIGVFVNSSEADIKQIAKTCGLKILQLHGNESSEFCAKFKGYKIIKSFRIKNKIDLKNILKYNIFAFLFDTYTPLKPGGTGKVFDWKLVRHVNGLKRPVFLSGGLNKNNVRKAIEIAKPDWVDASSCLEKSPGRKDIKKVKEFIKTAKVL